MTTVERLVVGTRSTHRDEGAGERTGVHGDPGGVRERALKRLHDLPAVDVVPSGVPARRGGSAMLSTASPGADVARTVARRRRLRASYM